VPLECLLIEQMERLEEEKQQKEMIILETKRKLIRAEN